MKIKKCLLVLSILLMLFTLTGCSKTVKTTADFKKIAEENNLVVADVYSQYSAYSFFKEATAVKSTDGWQIEFYVLSDEDHAVSMFDTNQKIFEDSKGKNSSSSSSEGSNFQKYTITTDGYYMHVCRVENTLLYLRVEEKFKSDVKKIVKKLGY